MRDCNFHRERRRDIKGEINGARSTREGVDTPRETKFSEKIKKKDCVLFKDGKPFSAKSTR